MDEEPSGDLGPTEKISDKSEETEPMRSDVDTSKLSKLLDEMGRSSGMKSEKDGFMKKAMTNNRKFGRMSPRGEV